MQKSIGSAERFSRAAFFLKPVTSQRAWAGEGPAVSAGLGFRPACGSCLPFRHSRGFGSGSVMTKKLGRGGRQELKSR